MDAILKRYKWEIAFLICVAILTVILFYFRAGIAFAQGGTPQVIALDESVTETQVVIRFAFWYPITKNPVPQTAGSVWVASGTSVGATAAQNIAIQNGTILEEVRSFSFPVGTPVSAIEATAQQAWTERNTQINGQGANQYYGNYFNGTSWAFQ